MLQQRKKSYIEKSEKLNLVERKEKYYPMNFIEWGRPGELEF